jgi:hypothetical protein
MNSLSRTLALAAAALFLSLAPQAQLAAPQAPLPSIPVKILMQSPADTQTDLQIICLFRSSPENTLHGSLLETNEKLHGLLDRIRRPDRFGGELGETFVVTPPPGTLAAKKLLIIGLGDSSTFTPERMEFIGKIAIREANRIGIAHPFFAPTILDGGVTRFSTGQISEQVVRGFREAIATHALVEDAGAAAPRIVQDFTYLAGPKFAADTQAGIDRALAEAGPAPTPAQ